MSSKISPVVLALLQHDERSALAAAEEGNPEKLAMFVIDRGVLETMEAREFIASRLRGEPKKRGNKRTSAQRWRDYTFLRACEMIQKLLDCSEYAAIKAMLEEEPRWNEETIKSTIRRAKADLKSTR